MFSFFIVTVLMVLQDQQSPAAGSISGVVVNASSEMAPVPGSAVVLSVELEGELVVAAEGVADDQGRFLFDDIPADPDYVYLPGANYDGVHYPGLRITLNAETPHARVNLVVHETVSDPNPLVIRRHDITIGRDAESIHVTEKLLIENPSSKTFVGSASRPGGRAATLRLSIPSNFRRTTFDKEFYGSQFTLIDDRLVTDIPWPPGQRELGFAYVLPGDASNQSWQREIDLPCDHLRIEVDTDAPEKVSCNLADLPSAGKTSDVDGNANTISSGSIVFESNDKTLAAGSMILVRLEPPPLTLLAYGRWIAIALLAGLIVAARFFGTRQRRDRNQHETDQKSTKHAKLG
ncbi:MAG: hypothetical protein KDB00_21640 [Planctomycetales bacterium]|nr:hypothetical protein [Planctomycetales bacterium]